jgi:DNA-binding transcriptional ArsR family regulator
MRISKRDLIPSSVTLLKGLADPTRLRIMALLARSGELCVCQIQGALGESQYKISRHLNILRHAGWVEEQRRGRWVHYAPVPVAAAFHENLTAALQSLPQQSLGLAVALNQIDALKKQTTCKE